MSVDHHDGNGPMHAYVVLGQMREIRNGDWTMYVSAVQAPVQIAKQDWATLRGNQASFRANGQVMHGELASELSQMRARNDANRVLANAAPIADNMT